MLRLEKANVYNYLILLLSSLFIIYFYSPILMAPNEVLFCKVGDGLGQYFAFTGYVQNSDSFLDNTTVNYPYGELLIYFDSQPILAVILKTLCEIFPGLKNYTIGYMNFWAIFFLWITPFFLYGILRRLKVLPMLAVLGAMGITILGPQSFRMMGHFSLSFAAAIPMGLYLLLRVHEGENPRKWLILLALNNIMWLYIHPYLGLMCCVLAGSIWFFYWLVNIRTHFKNYRTYLVPAMGMLFPVAFFQLVVKLTDSHTAKSRDIFGIFTYCGEPYDVFIPTHPPFRTIINAFYNTPIKQTWEGWAYVGVSTMLVFIIFVLNWIYKTIRRKKAPVQQAYGSLVAVAFWGAVPLLLLSWAIPFEQIPSLLDSFPVIKQFRSLGRFAWAFYYVATLTTIFIVHTAIANLRHNQEKILARILLIAVPFLYMAEGYMHHVKVSNYITQNPNYFIEKYRPEILTKAMDIIDPNEYQAIMPLPFYYLGSGNYYRPVLPGTTRLAMLTSSALDIPTISATISRGDVWESRNLMQLISPPYYYKKIQDDMPNKKPFLITLSSRDEPLHPYEQMILDRGRLIVMDELGRAYYELDYDDLFVDESYKIFNEFDKNQPNLYNKEDGWLTTDSTAYIYYEDFEDREAEHAFKGKGAFSEIKHINREILSFPTSPANDTVDQVYNVRLWVYNGAIDAMNYFFIEAKGSRNGQGSRYIALTRPDESLTVNGDWTLAECTVPVAAGQYDRVHLMTFGTTYSPNVAYVDEVLVYTEGDVYKVEKKDANGKAIEMIYNGHQLTRKQ